MCLAVGTGFFHHGRFYDRKIRRVTSGDLAEKEGRVGMGRNEVNR